MSDLFIVNNISYMDDGASNITPATKVDVSNWASKHGYTLVPSEPDKETSWRMIMAGASGMGMEDNSTDEDKMQAMQVVKFMIAASQEPK